MATTVQTGISAAPNTSVGDPQTTFVWSATVNGDNQSLSVTVGAGGFGNPPNNFQTTDSPIPWRALGQFSLAQSENPLIGVTGSVSVVWGTNGSYVVHFTGDMWLNSGPNRLDVASSNQAPVRSNHPIIVYAYVV